MRTILLALAILVAPGASCKKDRLPAHAADAAGFVVRPELAEEVEPNDTDAQATALLPGRPIRGRLDRRGDVDRYRVSTTLPRGVLRAEVTGVPGIALALSVHRVNPPRELGRAANGRAGEGEVVPNVGVTAGESIVVVRARGRKKAASSEPYTLTVSVAPASEGDELEPNDVRLDAQEIEPARAVHGFFGRRRDVDWYKVKLPEANGEFHLRVEMTAVPGVPRASLDVQDEIEVSLKKGWTRRGTGVLFPNLWVKPGQRMLYVVAAGPTRFNVSERYTLQATLFKPGATLEREPNDRPPNATRLAPGERTQGYLAPAGDEDWYAIESPGRSIARIAVTGVDHVDLTLSVHDAGGARRLGVDEGKMREGEILPNVPIPAGRSLVRVAAKGGQENVFQMYEITAELRSDPGDEEIEPNESAAEATPIALGAVRRGFLYPRGDVDVYRLDVPGAGAQRVRIELRGIPKVPLKLVVRDAGGGLPAPVGPRAPEETLTLEKDLLPGVHYLEVLGGGFSNPRDRYELRVTPL
jgi:hypothetical protein